MTFTLIEPAGSTTRRYPMGLGRISPSGDIYFVSSVIGNDANTGTRPGAGSSGPVATFNAAKALCVDDAGDVIVLLEGHAESIANATTVVMDKRGILVLGQGRGTKRPTFTFTNAAGNIPISAANVRIENILLTVSGTTDVTSGITVTGADVQLADVELRDGTATAQFVIGITLGAGSDRFRAVNHVLRSFLTGDALTAGIHCAVAIDGVEIIDANMDGLASNGLIYNVTTAMTNLTVQGGRLRQRHATKDSAIAVAATTTGYVIRPYIRTATNDADGFNLAIVAAGMQVYDVLVTNADGERGGYWGTASTA